MTDLRDQFDALRDIADGLFHGDPDWRTVSYRFRCQQGDDRHTVDLTPVQVLSYMHGHRLNCCGRPMKYEANHG